MCSFLFTIIYRLNILLVFDKYLPFWSLIIKFMNNLTDKKQLDALICMAPPFAPSMPPIGIGYLNSYLKSKNLNTEIYDINIGIYNTTDSQKKSLWQLGSTEQWSDINTINRLCEPAKREKIVDRILEKKPKTIGFSVNAANKFFTNVLINSIKKRKVDSTIVIGGPGCFYQTDRDFFPKDSVDAFIIGEGECSFYEFIKAKKEEKDISDIEGVLLPNQPDKFKKRDLIEDLDSLPHPDLNDFEITSYSSKSLPLMFSRGCINQCAFCSDCLIWNNKYRSRSAESVFAEIETSSKKTGIKDVVFYDLTINGDLKKLESFCNILIKKGSDFRFTANICVRKGLNSEFFTKLKTAGFFALYWGVESGSDKILKAMRKNFNSLDAHVNLKDSTTAGILNYVNFIVGFPGETENNFSETITFFEQNKKYIDGINNINICHLVAHTHIFNNYKNYEIENPTSEKWHENDNTFETRNNKLMTLKNIVRKNDKKIFNNGFLQEESEEYNVKNSLASLVVLPFFDIQIPSYLVAQAAGVLKQLNVEYNILDINMMLYQNVSEKNRTLWQQHKVTNWCNQNTFVNISKDLNVLDILSSVKSKFLIFLITPFNIESIKNVIEDAKKILPEKEIILLSDMELKHIPKDDRTRNLNLLNLQTIFGKQALTDTVNIIPDYSKLNLNLYEKNILHFDSVAFISDENFIKKQNDKVFLFNKLLKEDTLSKTGFRWAVYLNDFDNLDEKILCNAEFVVLCISSECESQKDINMKFCKLNKAAEIIKWCDEKKIKVFIDIVVGIPGETKKEFEKLFLFLTKNIDSIDTVFSAKKFIPSTEFLKLKMRYNIKTDNDLFPVLWTDNLDNNDHLRTVRLYVVTKLLKKHHKQIMNTNINYSLNHTDDTDVIREILQYKNEEVIELNEEKRNLVAEINQIADKKLSDMVANKDQEIKNIAAENKNNFEKWEKKFIKEVSLRDKKIEELYEKHNSLNEYIDILENQNNLMMQSIGYRIEKKLKGFFKKFFFLKDK